jgi:two-component system KDP operon response regulator KdpE
MSRIAKVILVVEDDPMLRSIIVRNLGGLGYMVLEAGTFREAADQMALRPALLILDIGLPDATGWDVAGWLDQVSRPVPIILISGGTPDARHLERFQPVAFLPKPFAIDDLLDEVERQLARPSTGFGV